MIKLLLILPCLFIMFQHINVLNAKVDKPNYEFNTDTFSDFSPGKTIDALKSKHGVPEIMSEANKVQTLKFTVSHPRYKFPVIVQARDGVILDYLARLPSYFLHDVFFQSLVNRLGKQNEYKKVGEEAYYVWNTQDVKHIYSAACTITCFPIFYAVQPTAPTTSPLLEQMKRNK